MPNSQNNAVMLYSIDREDYWIYSPKIFKTTEVRFLENAYNEIKPLIESSDFIKELIEDNSLVDDYFDGDETYRFVRTYWDYKICFVFQNNMGNSVEYTQNLYFVKIM